MDNIYFLDSNFIGKCENIQHKIAITKFNFQKHKWYLEITSLRTLLNTEVLNFCNISVLIVLVSFCSIEAINERN